MMRIEARFADPSLLIPVRIYGLRKRFSRRVWELGSKLREAIPSVIEGDCLAPYFVTGDIVFSTPQLRPQDGDLVAADMVYLQPSAIVGLKPMRIVRLAVKQYRQCDGKEWLCSAEGAVPAAPHKVRAVVVGWHRAGLGFWKWRKPVRTMRFSPEPSVSSQEESVLRGAIARTAGPSTPV